VRLPGRPRSLTGAQVVEALRLRGEGESFRDIAARLGVGRESVRRAIQRAQGVPKLDSVPLAPPEAVTVVSAPPAVAATAVVTAPSSREPTWPPPADSSTAWTTVPLGLSRVCTTQVRRVQLGERWFYVDGQSRLWCDDCYQVFTVAEAMAIPGRAHRISLDRRSLALVRPMGDGEHDAVWVEPVRYWGAW
jgi:hypothetical protein